MRAEAHRLLGAINLARSEAVLRNRPVSLCPSEISRTGVAQCSGNYAGGWLVGGLFVAWAKMDTTQLTYQVHTLRSEQAELQRRQRLLSSELARLHSPSYLDARASELGLEDPPPGVVIRVE